MANNNSVTLGREYVKGLWDENPVIRQILGMCPTLAVTNSAINGLAMGLATTFVLISASTVVSIIRKIVSKQVRIATYVVIIAAFVTVADLFLKAKFPPLSKALGPYIPLIVVNCIILGRSEAFASKYPVHRAFIDALGMGTGFTWALVLLGIIRETLGFGSIFGFKIMGDWFTPWIIMILPAGAFITLGLLIGLVNQFTGKKTLDTACH
ncbi:MAG: electron transport complex subunit RsxE [Thermodesulfobacteriota bacterium]